ncbi:LysR substrate-binding domain-containing protein [Novosphingobium resinovorum]|uniref:Transcriptional regulator n=1 Tax=Novosphingobium resinovorum TaxID=158500 RepID=A0A031JN64_9SPHN|nr:MULTISPECIES: LysR substrate-binding domain-containing protein [Sphingomonadaceae]AOR75333.1 LysR family transcriptional regulator [Novosphingobium resinovorum]EJU14083.1 transcriptional regulator [Sphingomonas sp. LH128]EZP74723.1 Transcriptional regulator [Novosphingobium resinovorum]MBF7010628.1 LysR family transcriptional regulator [Novosphingobium sp. HR1a]WJM28627.1 LysR substrate-binding domain-containing protein [Novosphingobium resinovorum]
MADFNDYAYFAEVVKHGGFAPAGRALRTPKSKLSRRIAALEERLGTRLIERSSRRFRVTEVGQAFYARCRAMLEEAEQAEALVAQAQAEPQGRIRFSCPRGMVEVLSPHLPAFLARYPKVALQLVATDRPVDLIAERVDVALRVRVTLDSDASLTMRTLGQSRRILVTGPALAASMQDATMDGLKLLPTLGSSDEIGEITWHLAGPDNTGIDHRHEPRMTCEDFAALREAAMANLGVALLPDHSCRDDLAAGRLVRILPEWGGQIGIVHLVFTTRRGLPPAVRAFIDHLASTFRALDTPR